MVLHLLRVPRETCRIVKGQPNTAQLSPKQLQAKLPLLSIDIRLRSRLWLARSGGCSRLCQPEESAHMNPLRVYMINHYHT